MELADEKCTCVDFGNGAHENICNTEVNCSDSILNRRILVVLAKVDQPDQYSQK